MKLNEREWNESVEFGALVPTAKISLWVNLNIDIIIFLSFLFVGGGGGGRELSYKFILTTVYFGNEYPNYRFLEKTTTPLVLQLTTTHIAPVTTRAAL